MRRRPVREAAASSPCTSAAAPGTPTPPRACSPSRPTPSTRRSGRPCAPWRRTPPWRGGWRSGRASTAATSLPSATSKRAEDAEKHAELLRAMLQKGGAGDGWCRGRGRRATGRFGSRASYPSNPHPWPPLHEVERGKRPAPYENIPRSSPPSPLRGEGPRVRIRRAGRPLDTGRLTPPAAPPPPADPAAP